MFLTTQPDIYCGHAEIACQHGTDHPAPLQELLRGFFRFIIGIALRFGRAKKDILRCTPALVGLIAFGVENHQVPMSYAGGRMAHVEVALFGIVDDWPVERASHAQFTERRAVILARYRSSSL